jgi:hypothetical protein
VCVPRCLEHLDCGHGFVCNPAGVCERVYSAVGSPCESELDCGLGQACKLEDQDQDQDGWLAATCAEARSGATLGNACTSHDGCRNGVCMLGTCTQLCRSDDECPAPFECTTMPWNLPGEEDASFFRGCLKPQAQIKQTLIADPEGVVRIPVPAMVRSFAIITSRDIFGSASIGDPIGIAALHAPPCPRTGDPDGTCLRALYPDTDVPGKQPLRYQPSPELSTLIVPNTPDQAMAPRPGVYTARLLPGTDPKVTVVYKATDATTLDLSFYFLDLRDHACLPGFDQLGKKLPREFESTYLNELRRILGSAGLTVGDIRYELLVDATGRSDLDGLRESDLSDLLRLSSSQGGIDIFFVRSISPAGIQVLSGANPGPPGRSGTGVSGIAVSVDTLCYRDWQRIARATAHGIGLYMGLFRNREPDGSAKDPIEDSDGSPSNLMFFGDLGGTQLSEGQKQVLRLYPGLR